MRRSALLLAACAFLTGCETTNVAPATHTGAQLEEDEARLWLRVTEEVDKIERSGFVANLPEAEAYLNGVLARLRPGPLPGGGTLRVRIIVDPTLNAFALPNGSIYIHTGMLSRLENEAQLATVVAHELTHATHRHGLKGYRNLKNETAFLATLTVGTGGGVGGLLGAVGVLASVSGYSRDLERDADTTGFKLLTGAGYDPREAPSVFRTLLADSKRAKNKEPYFFGSHPRLQERIDSFDQLVNALPPAARAGATDSAPYEAMLPPVLAANSEAALRAGDFDFARDCAERLLKLRPGDPLGRLHLAEFHRKRNADGDAPAALRLYRELAAEHPDLPGAQRGLGLGLMKTGDKPAAATAFRRYLALQPVANDRGYIEAFLQQCETTP